MDGDSLLAVVPAVTVALDICPRTPKAIVRKLLEKAEPFPTGGRNPLWPKRLLIYLPSPPGP